MKQRRRVEWWLIPVDHYGDSMEVFFCRSEMEARKEKARRQGDYPNAREWVCEKVVRWYAMDGELQRESVTEVPL